MSLDSSTLDTLAIAAAGVAVVSLVLAFVAVLRIGALKRSLLVLQGGPRRTARCSPRSTGTSAPSRTCGARCGASSPAWPPYATTSPSPCVHVAVIRYDAFKDMGGRMSFSAALLDDQGDGVVITAINGRSETRAYAKGIKNGQSDNPLSPEGGPGDQPRGPGPQGQGQAGRLMRTAVVTGAMSGLGRASAARLAADGVRVVGLDITPGADLVVDVTDADAVRAAAHELGPVDILINSAGIIGPNLPLWEISPAAWATTFAVNVTGIFNTCSAFVPAMREAGWGRIVNFASMAGKDGNPNLSALLGLQGCGHRPDQVPRQGARDKRRAGQCDRAGRHRHPMNDATAPEVLAPHHQPDPDEAGRPGRRGRRAGGLARLGQADVLHGCGLRHQRRPGDLLRRAPSVIVIRPATQGEWLSRPTSV